MSKVIYVVFPLIIIPISYYAYVKYKKRCVTPPEEIVYDIVFFTDKGAECRGHATAQLPCPKINSDEEKAGVECVAKYIRKIVSYIERTEETLDVCIYLLTCHDLANAILEVYKNGRKVRLIADADMINESGAQIKRLRRAGVPVRMKKSHYLMHHKFLIIDRKLLLTGSFNWTMQAMAGNWDNMIITSQPVLVGKFCGEFDDLWKYFSKNC
ncbi:uncharacterized protein zuc [Anabrus simplex]|uniref:uncharacterized protein zuc n=1 Tax=Anabrus simplex TaxID=316456 RepID=UPI0034DD63C7